MQRGYVGPLGHGWLKEPNASTVNCSSLTGYGQDYYWTFDASVHSVSSPYPRVYKKISYNPCEPAKASLIQTVPLYTAIIGLNRGAVEYVAWDDGCFFCAENGADCVNTALNLNGTTEQDDRALRGCRQTLDLSHTPPQDNCYPTVATDAANTTVANATTDGGRGVGNATSPCDLKVFVTWTGTDRHGKFLKSAGQRFSRFRAFGVASLYQGALNLGQDALDLANRIGNIANAIPGRLTPGEEDRRRRRLQVAAEEGGEAGGAGGGGGGGR
jgi:hypothetical protein